MGRSKAEHKFVEGMKFKWGNNDRFLATITDVKKMESETIIVMNRHDYESGRDAEVSFMASSLQDKINNGMVRVASEVIETTSESEKVLEE